jgi:hypothetical protein
MDQRTGQLAASDMICLLLPIRRIAIRSKYSISYAFDHLNRHPFKCSHTNSLCQPTFAKLREEALPGSFRPGPAILADLRFCTRRPSRMSRWPQLSQPASFTIDAHLE